MSTHAALALVETVVDKHADDLLDLRRDLHAHPELSWHETRTTDLVIHHLDQVGWRLTRAGDSGLMADLGDSGPLVALRADLDALPVNDTTADPWRSQVSGVAHACGHDVHTTALLGAGLALAEVHAAGLLPGRVRLLFQPAEEVMPGGASRLMNLGALDDVSRIFCLHCDPTIDVGRVGLREGPITGAADSLEIRLTGSGGHTSRPHLTEDLTFALGEDRHGAAGRALAPARPSRGRQRRLGPGRGGPGRQRDPRLRLARRHRADARRGRLERHGAADPHLRRRDRGAVRRAGDRRLQARRASGGQRPRVGGAARPCRRRGPRRRGTCADRPEPRRRGLRVVPRRAFPGPWAGSAPANPAVRRTTSTRATCASTSGPPASRPSCSRRSRSRRLSPLGNNWVATRQPG